MCKSRLSHFMTKIKQYLRIHNTNMNCLEKFYVKSVTEDIDGSYRFIKTIEYKLSL